ncbi:AEC family transporter [Chelatococcus sp. SYSU_G07232]|uniref:AEC family transporter n=1 Tax=Chelatococcus albus TaxID=3047466 RepID=A0ABT7AJQ3_9HYPH|nr:AEC family transporter [Chelatococcus sp. SYSU_G07232]MDJ1159583.1 AEC family transporter [Chelatococcus sp. SYSU_G07232]
MLAVLLVVLPVASLIAVGFFARLANLVSDRAGEGISDFVYALAVPCLIFRTLAKAQIPAVQPWGYWISYFAGVAVVWVLATVAARQLYRVNSAEGVVAGFSAGQANTVLVGIPLILKAYGEEGAVPLFLLIAIHLPIMMTVATLLVEGRGASPVTILRRLVTHPIVVAVLAGSASRLLPTGVPDLAWLIIEPIAGAAVPCALVAMGMALRRYGLGSGFGLPAVITVLKLVVHPLVVYLLATQAFSMPRAWAGVAVLFASAPSGINAYLFAERYRSGVGIASSAIGLSTVLSLFTTVFWLAVLGVGVN